MLAVPPLGPEKITRKVQISTSFLIIEITLQGDIEYYLLHYYNMSVMVVMWGRLW